MRHLTFWRLMEFVLNPFIHIFGIVQSCSVAINHAVSEQYKTSFHHKGYDHVTQVSTGIWVDTLERKHLWWQMPIPLHQRRFEKHPQNHKPAISFYWCHSQTRKNSQHVRFPTQFVLAIHIVLVDNDKCHQCIDANEQISGSSKPIRSVNLQLLRLSFRLYWEYQRRRVSFRFLLTLSTTVQT